MKKILIQTGLVASALFILGTAANAQNEYRAEIPFDFRAAGEAYTAGIYNIGRLSPSVPVVAIRDRKNSKTRLLGQVTLVSGHWNGDGKGKLIFLKTDDRYVLSEIVTPSFAGKLKKAKTDLRMASGPAAKLETVAINLR
jgi:hypothetical protein